MPQQQHPLASPQIPNFQRELKIWMSPWYRNLQSQYPDPLETHPLHRASARGRWDARVPRLRCYCRAKRSVASVGPPMANNLGPSPGNPRVPSSQWCAWIWPEPPHFASQGTWPPWSAVSGRAEVPEWVDGRRWPAWRDLDSPSNWPTEPC